MGMAINMDMVTDTVTEAADMGVVTRMITMVTMTTAMVMDMAKVCFEKILEYQNHKKALLISEIYADNLLLLCFFFLFVQK